MKILPVILSGGSGTRLWPVSRELYPKQFQAVYGDNTLFQQVLNRVSGPMFETPLCIAGDDHRFLIAQQAQEAGIELQNIILEPFGRNTAAAISLSAQYAKEHYGDDVAVLILPSDHVVEDITSFENVVKQSLTLVQDNGIVCFGITPDYPATEYGYIKQSSNEENKIDKFVEKPNLETAETYVKEGGYLWNSGMFIFKPSTMLSEIDMNVSKLNDQISHVLKNAEYDKDFIRLKGDDFEQVESISIDYAVMEKTDKAYVLPAAFDWSDVGGFKALWKLHDDQDNNQNVCLGDVVVKNTHRSYIKTDKHLVVANGVDDLNIIVNSDVVLVSKLGDDANVGLIAKELSDKGRIETNHHKRVYRPWGWYESIEEGSGFQVKVIEVYPGKKLSLQKHKHRAEHWTCVEGSGVVTRDDETIHLNVNETVFIPLGAVHRLENPTQNPLKIIEVQCGDYLGEDDIVRIEDDFGRA